MSGDGLQEPPGATPEYYVAHLPALIRVKRSLRPADEDGNILVDFEEPPRCVLARDTHHKEVFCTLLTYEHHPLVER